MRLKICENEIQNGIFPGWNFYDLLQTKKIHYGLHVKAIEITTNFSGNRRPLSLLEKKEHSDPFSVGQLILVRGSFFFHF